MQLYLLTSAKEDRKFDFITISECSKRYPFFNGIRKEEKAYVRLNVQLLFSIDNGKKNSQKPDCSLFISNIELQLYLLTLAVKERKNWFHYNFKM